MNIADIPCQKRVLMAMDALAEAGEQTFGERCAQEDERIAPMRRIS